MESQGVSVLTDQLDQPAASVRVDQKLQILQKKETLGRLLSLHFEVVRAVR